MGLGRILLASVAVSALAQPLIGQASEQPVRWVSEKINWCYDSADAPDGFKDKHVRRAIRAALDVWSDEVDLPFARREAKDCDERKPNLIRVSWTYRQTDWTGRATTTTRTTTTESGRLISESIVASRVLLNEANLVEDGEPLIGEMEQTLMHEIGHAIGLEHSDDEQSIMYPTVQEGAEFNRTDAAAVRALYGRRYQARPDGDEDEGRTFQASNR